MKRNLAEKAIEEARRFIEIAEAAKMADVDAIEYDAKTNGYKARGIRNDFASPSKHVAAVKRASMDLTRALAELRKRDNQ